MLLSTPLNHNVTLCSYKTGAAVGSLPRTAHLIKNFAQNNYHRVLSRNQYWIKIYKEIATVYGVQAIKHVISVCILSGSNHITGCKRSLNATDV